jgi:hypothetical protein
VGAQGLDLDPLIKSQPVSLHGALLAEIIREHCVTTNGTNSEDCPVFLVWLRGWIEPTTFRFCVWSYFRNASTA